MERMRVGWGGAEGVGRGMGGGEGGHISVWNVGFHNHSDNKLET